MLQDMDQDTFDLNMLHIVDNRNFEYILGDMWEGFLNIRVHTSKQLDRLFLCIDYLVHNWKGCTGFELVL